MSSIPTKLFLSLLFLIILALFLSGCNAFNPKNGSLQGEVHRETPYSTAPLEGVLISISGSTITTTTDQNGYFLLSDVPAGKRTLTIAKEGYSTLKLLNIFIEPNIINEAFFGKPIILRPKEDTVLYDMAIDYLNQKDYQQALNTFLELRDTFPESSWVDDAYYYIGNIYEIHGLYISANFEYSQLLLHYPDSPWAAYARLGIGNCFYYGDNDYNQAKKQYQSVIDNYPFSDLISLAYYRIAWCDKGLGNFEEAIQNFQQIIALYPQSVHTPPSQYFIGEIYYNNLKNYNEAFTSFYATINNYPSATWPDETRLIAPAAYFYIAKCYEKQGKWQEAIDNYEVIIAQYPDSTWGNGKSIIPEAYYYIGNCYEKLTLWQKAIDAYQIIIAQYPGSTWDNGKSIPWEAQERINFIRENYFP